MAPKFDLFKAISTFKTAPKPEKAAKYAPLGEYYKGREINLKFEDYENNEDDADQAAELRRSRKDSVLFIRAAFGRSCAVTKRGRVFVWG